MRVHFLAIGILAAIARQAQCETDSGVYQRDADTLCSTGKDGREACYPRVFNAAAEFRQIMPGQEVPAGLHIQIDMATGQRQARLMPAEAGDVDNANAVELNAGAGQEVLAVNHAYTDRFQELIERVLDAGAKSVDRSANELLDEQLDELKELVYDPRQAERLLRTPGAVAALLQLSNPMPTLQAWAASTQRLSSIIIGTTVQNNPELQAMAYRLGAIPSLLHALRDERDAKTAGKHVFALSALTRGHSLALEQFINLGGFRILSELNPLASVVYKGEIEASKLDLRIVRFVEDMLNPEFNPRVAATSASMISQFAGVWCSTLAARLVDSLEDVVDDDQQTSLAYERRLAYLRSLRVLQQAHRDMCILPASFKRWKENELSRINHSDAEYRQVLENIEA
ncbi:nucleotide exchange factor sil1 [Coemansia sp. RSA 2706]|nr:nucleotide exchange factor sil1 [Coemansia sp. RSA 2706]